ncbi:MAG: hypothetical protein AB7V48_06605 [Sedimentibacter sp.]
MYNNVAGAGGKNCSNVAGDFGRRRCDFVFECLEELLEDVLGDRGRRRRCDCDCVFECLEELLEDALGENDRHNCHCHRD